MKIFTEEGGSFRHKVNFVDSYNVCLGYDLSQDCCEYANWFISDEIERVMPKQDDVLYQRIDGWDDWQFDRYFMHVEDVGERDFDVMAVFRMFHKNRPREYKYIHLFNCHNGYYGHGFTFGRDGITIWEGAI